MEYITTEFDPIISFIRDEFGKPTGEIPLNRPHFKGNEKAYLADCIESGLVSSTGPYIDAFEASICKFLGAQKAVAMVNGTTALQIALELVGVKPGELVITQPMTFVATCNAIVHAGGQPLFIDIDLNTLGISPQKLAEFMDAHTTVNEKGCFYEGRRIGACLPVHTFGHPVRIDELMEVCEQYRIPLVEDSTESIGSKFQHRFTGTFGKLGVFSFNGNKTITCGGGGILVTDDHALAKKAKHLINQAKLPNSYEYHHDTVGYNYQMPNLNAALALAQMECLEEFLSQKRMLAMEYQDFLKDKPWEFFMEPPECQSNYWLNALVFPSEEDRNQFVETTNRQGIATRPAWKLMTQLSMYEECFCANLDNAQFINNKIANVPSSVRF